METITWTEWFVCFSGWETVLLHLKCPDWMEEVEEVTEATGEEGGTGAEQDTEGGMAREVATEGDTEEWEGTEEKGTEEGEATGDEEEAASGVDTELAIRDSMLIILLVFSNVTRF